MAELIIFAVFVVAFCAVVLYQLNVYKKLSKDS